MRDPIGLGIVGVCATCRIPLGLHVLRPTGNAAARATRILSTFSCRICRVSGIGVVEDAEQREHGQRQSSFCSTNAMLTR
jgi:hypothetical protein